MILKLLRREIDRLLERGLRDLDLHARGDVGASEEPTAGGAPAADARATISACLRGLLSRH